MIAFVFALFFFVCVLFGVCVLCFLFVRVVVLVFVVSWFCVCFVLFLFGGAGGFVFRCVMLLLVLFWVCVYVLLCLDSVWLLCLVYASFCVCAVFVVFV